MQLRWLAPTRQFLEFGDRGVPRRRLPGGRRRPCRLWQQHACSSIPAATSTTAAAIAWAPPGCGLGARPHDLLRDGDRTTSSTASSDTLIWTRSTNGRRTATRSTRTSNCRANSSPTATAASSTARPIIRLADRILCPGDLPVHAALAGRGALRPGERQQANRRPRRQHGRQTGTTPRRASAMLEYNTSEFGRFRAAVQRRLVARQLPITRRSCNTSSASGRTAPTRFEEPAMIRFPSRVAGCWHSACFCCSGPRPPARSMCSPASPNGARWRKSWAATRSMSASAPRRRCRTRTRSRRGRR